MTHTSPLPRGSSCAFKALSFAEQLTLWAIRLWSGAHAGTPGLHEMMRTGFALARTPDGYLALDRVMTYLVTGTRVGIEICCPECREVGRDERFLLDCLADAQAGRIIAARTKLACWLREDSLAPALAACLDYAEAMASGLQSRNSPRSTGNLVRRV